MYPYSTKLLEGPCDDNMIALVHVKWSSRIWAKSSSLEGQQTQQSIDYADNTQDGLYKSPEVSADNRSIAYWRRPGYSITRVRYHWITATCQPSANDNWAGRKGILL